MVKSRYDWEYDAFGEEPPDPVQDQLDEVEKAASLKLNKMARETLPKPRKLNPETAPEELIDTRRYWHARFQEATAKAQERLQAKENDGEVLDPTQVRRAVFEGLTPAQKKYVIADMILDGMTELQVAEELQLAVTRVKQFAKMSHMELRVKELQEMKAQKSLIPSLPVMQVVQKYTLCSLALYAQDFFLNQKWKDLSPRDATALLDLATKVHEMQRLNAGKPTQQIEVVNRTKREVDMIVNAVTSAKPEDGGDPFVNYGQASKRKA